MAIDADVHAGVLDAEGARRKRARVQREADFYAAMDGAGKFVDRLILHLMQQSCGPSANHVLLESHRDYPESAVRARKTYNCNNVAFSATTCYRLANGPTKRIEGRQIASAGCLLFGSGGGRK
jgi:hypothetical protein